MVEVTKPGWHAQRQNMAGFALFSLLLIYRLSRHAMWRDELQAWMIARASPDLVSLFQNLRYEGHPPLWYLTLWPLAQLTSDPIAMQVLSAGLGLATLLMLWFLAPFSIIEKLMLSSSYFIGFEYGVISRGYVLALTLLFAFLALGRTIDRRRWLGWVILGLLANTHFIFALVALILAGTWIHVTRNASPQRAPALLFAVLTAIAALTMVRSDLFYDNAWRLHLDWALMLDYIARFRLAFMPSTGDDWRYWHLGLPSVWRYLSPVICLVLIGAYLRSQRLLLSLFLLLSVATTGFFYLRYGGYVWHTGGIFLAFVAITWLCRDRGRPLGHAALFLALLAPNAAGGLNAMVRSTHEPLSMARNTARWIDEHGLHDEFWMGWDYEPSSAVAGYLRKEIYYFECDCMGSFVKWPRRRSIGGPSIDAVRAALREHGRTRGYLITNRALDDEDDRRGDRARRLARFEGSEVKDEQFYLFELTTREHAGNGPS